MKTSTQLMTMIQIPIMILLFNVYDDPTIMIYIAPFSIIIIISQILFFSNKTTNIYIYLFGVCVCVYLQKYHQGQEPLLLDCRNIYNDDERYDIYLLER